LTFRDPLLDWELPDAVKKWAEEVSPPSKNACLDYLSYYVHPDVVRLVGRLLIPAFVEHEGGVFLRSQFSFKGYADWKKKLGDVVAIEKVINHQHVYDLFATQGEVAEASFEGVANLMAQSIRLALCYEFPDRVFNVYVTNTDQDYGPIVCFHSTDLKAQASGFDDDYGA
jgi:hypothetical protein